MAQVPIEELLKRCGSVYKLTILSARRAKELIEGSSPLVPALHKKVTSIALEEILEGKVLYKPEEEPEGDSGKKGRGAKPKAKDKRKAAT
jgi:DNA-directed RNA polymerase subunit omega